MAFFTKTLPVTAGLLQAVNHAPPLARFRTAAWSPSSAGNAIRHVPWAPRTTQEGMQGHTQTTQCARTHTFALAFMRILTRAHARSTQAKSPQDVRWIGLWHQGWGAKGISQQAAVSVVSLTGM